MVKNKRMLIFFLKGGISLILFLLLLFFLGIPMVQADDRITNSIGMKFVYISSGSFFMGSGENELNASAHEKPLHKVTLNKDFYLGIYEVTQEQWEKIMGSNPFNMIRSYPDRWDYLIGQGDRFVSPQKPATVSWNDAQEFIQKLNEIEGHTKYRLPTEAEWEYACRGGTNTAYSFGNDRKELSQYAWYGEDFNTGSLHIVGTKKPNNWGLYDMHGNVWEWVQDYYSANYYSISPELNPLGPETGSTRTVRGGSWHSTAGDWRSAYKKKL